MPSSLPAGFELDDDPVTSSLDVGLPDGFELDEEDDRSFLGKAVDYAGDIANQIGIAVGKTAIDQPLSAVEGGINLLTSGANQENYRKSVRDALAQDRQPAPFGGVTNWGDFSDIKEIDPQNATDEQIDEIIARSTQAQREGKNLPPALGDVAFGINRVSERKEDVANIQDFRQAVQEGNPDNPNIGPKTRAFIGGAAQMPGNLLAAALGTPVNAAVNFAQTFDDDYNQNLDALKRTQSEAVGASNPDEWYKSLPQEEKDVLEAKAGQTALISSLPNAAIETLADKLLLRGVKLPENLKKGLGGWAAEAPKTAFTAEVLARSGVKIGTEAATEVAQQGVSNLTRQQAIDPNTSLAEGFQESFFGGLGGGTAASGLAVRETLQEARKSREREALELENDTKAAAATVVHDQAQEEAEVLENNNAPLTAMAVKENAANTIDEIVSEPPVIEDESRFAPPAQNEQPTGLAEPSNASQNEAQSSQEGVTQETEILSQETPTTPQINEEQTQQIGRSLQEERSQGGPETVARGSQNLSSGQTQTTQEEVVGPDGEFRTLSNESQPTVVAGDTMGQESPVSLANPTISPEPQINPEDTQILPQAGPQAPSQELSFNNTQQAQENALQIQIPSEGVLRPEIQEPQQQVELQGVQQGNQLQEIAQPSQEVSESQRADSESVREALQPDVATTEAATSEGQGGTTSTKNAYTDAERIRMGLPPRMKPETITDQYAADEADRQLREDAGIGRRLVEEIKNNPRAVDPIENQILLREEQARKLEFEAAINAVNRIYEVGNSIEREQVMFRLELAREANQAIFDILNLTGTKAAQALRARQRARSDEDYSLVKMEQQRRAVGNGGMPLSSKQLEETQASHEKIIETRSNLETAEQKAQDAELKRYFSLILKQNKKEVAKGRKEGRTAASVIEDAANKARARIRARTGSAFSGVDPTVIVDVSIIGADYLTKGITKLADFTARLVKEFGERIRPFANQIFDSSNQYLKTVTDAESPVVVKGVPLTSNIVGKLVRDQVNKGVTELDTVMNAIKADLSDTHPDITVRELRDIFSQYGKVTFPSKEEDAKAVRELRRLSQLVSSLEDLYKGQAPKRTGMQRDQPTQKIRELEKEVARVAKALGVQVTSPETQLKSALDAIKSRLRNSIEDLEKQIATRTKTPKKEAVEYDAEANSLKARRDALRAQLKAIEGPQEISDEQKIANSIAAAERSIADLEKRIQEQNYNPDVKVAGPTNDKLNELRAERDVLRSFIDYSRKESEPKKSDAERAQETLEKRLSSQIRELARQFETGTKREKADPTIPGPKAEQLKKIRDRIKDSLQKIEGNTSLTDEQRLKRSTDALNKSIKEYERRLKEKDFSARSSTSALSTPELDALREKRDAIAKDYKDAKAGLWPARSKEEIDLERYKRGIITRTQTIRDRIAAKDYAVKSPTERKLDAEATKALYEYQQAKNDFNKAVFEDALARRNKWQKTGDFLKETNALSRAVITSADLSGLLRQGGFIALSNPARGIRAIKPMLQAFRSKEGDFKVNQEIKERPNYNLYQQAGLFLSVDDDITLSKLEEEYRSRWASKVPGVAGSARAYSAVLNRLRADTFDAMVANLGPSGAVTRQEAKDIANYINIATGRGDLGRFGGAADLLNQVFFAPRYVVSRFQLLSANPIRKASTPRVRNAITTEYGKYLTSVAIIVGLAAAAGAEVEEDPRSSDFLKIKIGDTRIDFLSGLVQSVVFFTRFITGESKGLNGKITVQREAPNLRPLTAIREKSDPLNRAKVAYGKDNTLDAVWRFARTKLSPLYGSIATVAANSTDPTGKKTTPGEIIVTSFIPISVRDIGENIEKQGIPATAAMTLANTLGIGVATYDDPNRQADDRDK